MEHHSIDKIVIIIDLRKQAKTNVYHAHTIIIIIVLSIQVSSRGVIHDELGEFHQTALTTSHRMFGNSFSLKWW